MPRVIVLYRSIETLFFSVSSNVKCIFSLVICSCKWSARFACLVTGFIASYSSSCHHHHHPSSFLAYVTSRYSFCLLLRYRYPFWSNNDQVNITLMWFLTLIHNNNPKGHKLYIIKMSTNPITTKNFVNGQIWIQLQLQAWTTTSS